MFVKVGKAFSKRQIYKLLLTRAARQEDWVFFLEFTAWIRPENRHFPLFG